MASELSYENASEVDGAIGFGGKEGSVDISSWVAEATGDDNKAKRENMAAILDTDGDKKISAEEREAFVEEMDKADGEDDNKILSLNYQHYLNEAQSAE